MNNSTLLILNAGSSSIKFALFSAAGTPELLLRGESEALDKHAEASRFLVHDGEHKTLADENIAQQFQHDTAVTHMLNWLGKNHYAKNIIGAGHRVVHGADKFSTPVLVDKSILIQLESFIPLAPLHQPHNLSAIRALQALHPTLQQVACFDTAFHQTQPPVAMAFALPRELSAMGIKRYGFHGLSYEYIASVLPKYLGSLAEDRVIVAHLGNGASMCAMHERKSVATTMGFTALDGLMMGTRSGAIDPGVILYLQQEKKYSAEQITDLLYRQSGLLGVSGISGDMRILSSSNDPRATEAIDLFVYRILRELGSLAAALGGLDALVFTGGIGQHNGTIRQRVCADTAWLGVKIDVSANHSATVGAKKISASNSAVETWVIPANEELIIAKHTARLCSGQL